VLFDFARGYSDDPAYPNFTAICRLTLLLLRSSSGSLEHAAPFEQEHEAAMVNGRCRISRERQSHGFQAFGRGHGSPR
jgi:hypothetical protein